MAKEVIFHQETIENQGWSIDEYLMYSYRPIGIADGFEKVRDFLGLYLSHGYQLNVTPICRNEEDSKTTDLLFTLMGDFSLLPPEEQKRRKEIEEDFYNEQ